MPGAKRFSCISLVKETATIYISDKQAQLAGNIFQEASLNVVIVQGRGDAAVPVLPSRLL